MDNRRKSSKPEKSDEEDSDCFRMRRFSHCVYRKLSNYAPKCRKTSDSALLDAQRNNGSPSSEEFRHLSSTYPSTKDVASLAKKINQRRNAVWRRADLWTEYERSNQKCEENENRRSKSMPDLEDGIEENEEEKDEKEEKEEKEEEKYEKERAESDSEHPTMIEKRVRELSVIEDSVCFMQERKGAPVMKYRRISDSLMNDILEDNHNVYEFASKELDVSEAESYVQNLAVRRNAIGYEDRKESYAEFMNYLRNKLIAEMF